MNILSAVANALSETPRPTPLDSRAPDYLERLAEHQAQKREAYEARQAAARAGAAAETATAPRPAPVPPRHLRHRLSKEIVTDAQPKVGFRVLKDEVSRLRALEVQRGRGITYHNAHLPDRVPALIQKRIGEAAAKIRDGEPAPDTNFLRETISQELLEQRKIGLEAALVPALESHRIAAQIFARLADAIDANAEKLCAEFEQNPFAKFAGLAGEARAILADQSEHLRRAVREPDMLNGYSNAIALLQMHGIEI